MTLFSFVWIVGSSSPLSYQIPTRCYVWIIVSAALEEAQLFTVLGAVWGYWKLEIKDEDEDETAFTSHVGTYYYTRSLLTYATRLLRSNVRSVLSYLEFHGRRVSFT